MRSTEPNHDPIASATTACPAPGETPPPRTEVDVTLAYPRAGALLLSINGAIDAATVDRVEHTLWPRLTTALQLIVLDLQPLAFLGVTGLDLLHQARLRAASRHIALRIVATHPEVWRALHMADLDVLGYESLPQALAEPDGTETLA